MSQRYTVGIAAIQCTKMYVTPEYLEYTQDAIERKSLLYFGKRDASLLDADTVSQTVNQHMRHLIYVLQDITIACSSAQLESAQAEYYLRYGLGRRTSMVRGALENIARTAPIDRKEPLQLAESAEMSRDINTIYLNIVGMLDNCAYILLNEKDRKSLEKLNPVNIGLFFSCIIKNPIFKILSSRIQTHDNWRREISKLRNPAAHRIPLTVPPSLVNEEETKEYNSLSQVYWEQVKELKFDEARSTFSDLNNIGTFAPLIVHHPDDAPIGLYPTLPDDLVHALMIIQSVFVDLGIKFPS